MTDITISLKNIDDVLEIWTVDPNGHFHGYTERGFGCFFRELFPHQFKSQRLLDLMGHLFTLSKSSSSSCEHCGESLEILFDNNEKSIKVLGDPCRVPEGLYDVSLELNVPSGRLVFNERLREIFPRSFLSINTNFNLVRIMKEYEKLGMIYGYVGDSFPSVYKNSDGHMLVGCVSRRGDIAKTFKKGQQKWRNIGSSKADHLFYCAADYDDIRRRMTSMNDFHELIHESTVTPVYPGVYRFDHKIVRDNLELDDIDSESSDVFNTKIKWSREPSSVDLFEVYNRENYTVGQCLVSSVMHYPELYLPNKYLKEFYNCDHNGKICLVLDMPKDDKEWMFANFADSVFVRIGRGGSWHKNGWLSRVPMSSSLPDVDIPTLDINYAFSEIYEESALSYAAIDKSIVFGDVIYLNSSFRKLVFNMLCCMMKNMNSSKNKQNEKQVRDIFARLSGRYPNDVPECASEFFGENP